MDCEVSSKLVDSSTDQDEEQFWYVCLVCKRAFERGFQLKKHRKKVHDHGKHWPKNAYQPKDNTIRSARSTLLLTKDDLLPRIQLQSCTGFSSVPPPSLPQDTGTLVDLTKEVSGCSTDLANNKSSNLPLIRLKQPTIKLVKLQLKAKPIHYKNRFLATSSSTQSAGESTKSCGDKQKESPKYFSSIVVNQSLNVVKSELNEKADRSVTDSTLLETFVNPSKIAEESPTLEQSPELAECLQYNETDNEMSDHNFVFEMDGQSVESSECFEFYRQPFPDSDSDLNDTNSVGDDDTKSELTDNQGKDVILAAQDAGADENKQPERQALSSSSTSNNKGTKVLTAAADRKPCEESDQHQIVEASASNESPVQIQYVGLSGGNCQPNTETPFRQAELKYHDQRGTRKRPFKCGWPHCRKTYIRKCHLKDHQKRIHIKKSRYGVPTKTLHSNDNATASQLTLVEEELAAEYDDQFERKDVKLAFSLSEGIDTIQPIETPDKSEGQKRTRKAKLQARASISKSTRAQSESEADDESDLEFLQDVSSSSEENEVHNDELEVENDIEKEAQKFVQASNQILLKLANRREKMYFECIICHCRYSKPILLERHIKSTHSITDISNYKNVFEVSDEGKQSQDHSGCTETTKAEAIRTCKTCGAVLNSVSTMNAHVIQVHLNRKSERSYSPREKRKIVSEIDDESVWELADASRKVLLKVDNQEDTVILLCRICPCKFRHLSSMQRHIKSFHSKDEVENALSSIQNTNKNDGSGNVSNTKLTEMTDPEEIRRCKLCGVVRRTQTVLNSHILQVHLKKTRVQCPKCDKEFTTKTHMKGHLFASHGLEKKFLCNICGKFFRAKTYLRRHTVRVHDVYKGTVPVFKCKVCERPCSTPFALKEHMVIHSEATHLCTICGKSFRQEQSYQNHMRKHGDERPYKCKQCPAAFKVSAHLNHHARIEHKGRTYDCGQCGKKFNNPNKRALHVKKDHHGQIYKCDVCEKVLGNPTALKLHKQRFHDPNFKRNFECDICQKVFMFPSLLANHKKAAHGDGGQVEKKFQCEECGKKFKFRCQLKTHSASHGSKSKKKKKKQESSHSEDDTSSEDS